MTFFDQHGLAILVAWYAFSAIVSGMPEPAPGDTKPYLWAFHALHSLAGDFASVIGSRVPRP